MTTTVLVLIFEGGPAANYPASKIEDAFDKYTDSIIDFSVEGAVYQFDDEDVYPVLIVSIDGYNSYNYDLLKDEYTASLESIGYGWKYDDNVGYDLLVSPKREIGITMDHDSDGLTIEFYDIDGDDLFVNYKLTTSDQGIDADFAVLYVWVWGGVYGDGYGDGQWIELYYEDTYGYYYPCDYIDDSATGMKVVRLSDDPADLDVWDDDTSLLIWNQTDVIDITGNDTDISFHFLGWGE